MSALIAGIARGSQDAVVAEYFLNFQQVTNSRRFRLGNSNTGLRCTCQKRRRRLKVAVGNGTGRLTTGMWCMQVLQEQKPVFVALGVANMHPPAIGIDIRYSQA